MIKFFHTPKPRKFEYKPRYYNEQKERIEELKRKFEGNEFNEEIMREKMRVKWGRSEEKAVKNKLPYRTLVLIVIVAALIFFIFK